MPVSTVGGKTRVVAKSKALAKALLGRRKGTTVKSKVTMKGGRLIAPKAKAGKCRKAKGTVAAPKGRGRGGRARMPASPQGGGRPVPRMPAPAAQGEGAEDGDTIIRAGTEHPKILLNKFYMPDTAAVKCMRNTCGALPVQGGPWGFQIEVDGVIVAKGNGCYKCIQTYIVSFFMLGTWPIVAELCNEDPNFDSEFEKSTKVRLTVGHADFPQGAVSMVELQGLTISEAKRGLTPSLFKEAFGYGPERYSDVEVLTLPGVLKPYEGSLVNDEPQLVGKGVLYQWSRKIYAQKEEQWTKVGDIVRPDQLGDTFDTLQRPSGDEDPEIKVFRNAATRALAPVHLWKESELIRKREREQEEELLRAPKKDGKKEDPKEAPGDATGVNRECTITLANGVTCLIRPPSYEDEGMVGKNAPSKNAEPAEHLSDDGNNSTKTTTSAFNQFTMIMGGVLKAGQKKRRIGEAIESDPTGKGARALKDGNLLDAAVALSTRERVLALAPEDVTKYVTQMESQDVVWFSVTAEPLLEKRVYEYYKKLSTDDRACSWRELCTIALPYAPLLEPKEGEGDAQEGGTEKADMDVDDEEWDPLRPTDRTVYNDWGERVMLSEKCITNQVIVHLVDSVDKDSRSRVVDQLTKLEEQILAIPENLPEPVGTSCGNLVENLRAAKHWLNPKDRTGVEEFNAAYAMKHEVSSDPEFEEKFCVGATVFDTMKKNTFCGELLQEYLVVRKDHAKNYELVLEYEDEIKKAETQVERERIAKMVLPQFGKLAKGTRPTCSDDLETLLEGIGDKVEAQMSAIERNARTSPYKGEEGAAKALDSLSALKGTLKVFLESDFTTKKPSWVVAVEAAETVKEKLKAQVNKDLAPQLLTDILEKDIFDETVVEEADATLKDIIGEHNPDVALNPDVAVQALKNLERMMEQLGEKAMAVDGSTEYSKVGRLAKRLLWFVSPEEKPRWTKALSLCEAQCEAGGAFFCYMAMGKDAAERAQCDTGMCVLKGLLAHKRALDDGLAKVGSLVPSGEIEKLSVEIDTVRLSDGPEHIQLKETAITQGMDVPLGGVEEGPSFRDARGGTTEGGKRWCDELPEGSWEYRKVRLEYLKKYVVKSKDLKAVADSTKQGVKELFDMTDQLNLFPTPSFVTETDALVKEAYATISEALVLLHLSEDKSKSRKMNGVKNEIKAAKEALGCYGKMHPAIVCLAAKAKDMLDFGYVKDADLKKKEEAQKEEAPKQEEPEKKEPIFE